MRRIISIKNMTKTYNEVRALDNLSLNLERGISGLIGPNGAGKTTLMKILVGLLHPDSGSGEVLGYDIAGDSLEIRRELGVLHERPVFPKNMTPLSYLEHVRHLYPDSRDPHELLSLVGIASVERRKIGTLSRGMFQRLGIAQALIGSPRLLILDEPTANIDVDGREAILQLLLTIHDKQGVSILVSSHVLSELEKVCHQVAFIQKGRIIEAGRVQEVISAYTASMYRIITSHPRKILEEVSAHPLIKSASVSGASSILIKVDSSNIEEVRLVIMNIARAAGVEVYAISESKDLQDAYKEIMENE